MDWGTLGAVAAIVFGAVGLQSFWIAPGFDGLTADANRRFAEIEASLERIETALLGLDRRVTRLEERL